jgi:hypothetical protein
MWWNQYVKHLPGQDSKATISVGEKFLYELKAGPAGGLRPPSAGTS